MADIYVRKGGVLTKQDFSLFELMTSEREGYIESTRTVLAGMKYPHLDMCPYKNFLADERLDIIANIFPESREIFILPYKNPKTGERPNLFYDQSKAMGDGGIYYYDGDMADALGEFEHEFVFHRAEIPASTRQLLQMKLDDIPPEKRLVVTQINVPLANLF